MPTAGESYRTILRQGCGILSHCERPEISENADFEAFQLLEKVYGLSRSDYLLRADSCPDPGLLADYQALLRRRLTGEPLQYLLGEWEFMGLPFDVGPGVLIPRPETELLAEQVLAHIKGIPSPRVLELCGGSGCLAISIAHMRPDAMVSTVELSSQALPYLQKNIERNHCGNVQLIAGDALTLLPEVTDKRYHVILSNPPYIAAAEIAQLQTEVQWEPTMALDGGADGLQFYRAFARLYPPLLLHGGLLAFEIGEDQGDAVSSLLAEAGMTEVSVLRDYAGLPRIVTGKSPL